MNRRVRRAIKYKKEIMGEISDENDQLKRLFKTCMKKSRKKPKVVVCSKGKPALVMKGRVRYVDRRMKKDYKGRNIKKESTKTYELNYYLFMEKYIRNDIIYFSMFLIILVFFIAINLLKCLMWF